MADCVLQNLIPDTEHLAETKVAKYRLPGMALGIIRDQELAWFGRIRCSGILIRTKSLLKTRLPASLQ